jgi:hypothetical protein
MRGLSFYALCSIVTQQVRYADSAATSMPPTEIVPAPGYGGWWAKAVCTEPPTTQP